MDKLITVKTFTYPLDLAVVRGRLESEGIRCFVQDEMMAQVNPFYSNAIGGVKLQVRESDVARAVEILEEVGLLKESDFRPTPIYTLLDNATFRIPFLRGMRVEFRLMLIVGVIVAVGLLLMYLAFLPSRLERLTNATWCVDNVMYGDQSFEPKTTDAIRLLVTGSCDESLNFRENGDLSLPGFNTRSVNGAWELIGGDVSISRADSFGFLYNGRYDLSFSTGRLILRSAKTIIYCHEEHLGSRF